MKRHLFIFILLFFIVINLNATPFKFGFSGSRNWLEADVNGDGYNWYVFGGVGLTPQFYILLSKGFGELYPDKDTLHVKTSQLTLNGRYYFKEPGCVSCPSTFFEFGAGMLSADLFPKERFETSTYDDFIFHAGLGIDFHISKHFSLTLLGKYNYITCDYLDGIEGGEFDDGFYEVNLGMNLNLGSLFSGRDDLDRLYTVNKIWPLREYPEDRFVNNDPNYEKEYVRENKNLEKRLRKLEKKNTNLEKKIKNLHKNQSVEVDTIVIEKTVSDTIFTNQDSQSSQPTRANTIEDIPLDDIYCAPCNEADSNFNDIPMNDDEVVTDFSNEKLNEFLVSWTNAWEERDLDRYMSHYAPYFRTYKLNYQQYYQEKKRIFDKTGSIYLVLKDIHVINKYDSTVQVKFYQYYKSDNYIDFGEKKLLIDTSHQYKIINESWKRRILPANFFPDSFFSDR